MRTTTKKRRLILRVLTAALAGVALVIFAVAVGHQDIVLLNPQGTIARQQRDLLLFATILSLFVILPVFALTFHIVRTYRVRQDGSQRAKKSAYAPNLDGNNKLEALWWGIPSLIILVLSIVTWQTSHSLDPYKPLSSDVKPLHVQVIAMQWKWLFIYPEQKIATVNYLKIPVGTPVNFEITSDAPMNSFWIPQLGGQVYAMTGMTSQLHLQADALGTYRGVSANLSGAGFADMHFKTEAVSDQDFRGWVTSQRSTGEALNGSTYALLRLPSTDIPTSTFGSVDNQTFSNVLDRYMTHDAQQGLDSTKQPQSSMDMMKGMDHVQ